MKIAGYPLYRQHWLLFVPVHANTIPAGYSYITVCINETHSQANLSYFGRQKYKKHKQPK